MDGSVSFLYRYPWLRWAVIIALYLGSFLYFNIQLRYEAYGPGAVLTDEQWMYVVSKWLEITVGQFIGTFVITKFGGYFLLLIGSRLFRNIAAPRLKPGVKAAVIFSVSLMTVWAVNSLSYEWLLQVHWTERVRGDWVDPVALGGATFLSVTAWIWDNFCRPLLFTFGQEALILIPASVFEESLEVPDEEESEEAHQVMAEVHEEPKKKGLLGGLFSKGERIDVPQENKGENRAHYDENTGEITSPRGKKIPVSSNGH